MKPTTYVFIFCLFVVSACKSPFSRTSDSSSGPAGSIGGSGQFSVFNNELLTGGGAFEYPGGDNLSLSFTDSSSPSPNSKRSIRFSWTGQPTVPGGDFSFAGFSLMHVPVFANYATTPGRDLHKAGYTHVVFYARANLGTFNSVTIEAGGPNPEACVTLSPDGSVDNCGNLYTGNINEGHATDTISSSWKQYSLPISGSQQTAIKDFFKATLVFDESQLTPGSTNPGQGGTVYLDQIFYKP